MNGASGKVDNVLIGQALGHMEAIEYASLVWGSVDGGFDYGQLVDEFVPLLEARGHPNPEEGAEELIEELLERTLACECRTVGGKTVLRSRFAEGVRLLTRLRQLFPHRDWRQGAPLVADYRVDLRPRRYPNRDLCPGLVLKELNKKRTFTPVMTAVWGCLVPPDGELRLSGFQARAAETILEGVKRAAIVTAGTGSGKTLAFYLPALTDIADKVQANVTWTKCLAIYPRVELLKDQFAEALDMCARIQDTLIAQGRRPLTVGTLFERTPTNASQAEDKWQRGNGIAGLICPYSRCSVATGEGTCEGDLVWLDSDRNNKRERLICRKCGDVIEEDSIILTRERALQTPPDILFTTMEMVHKRLADPQFGRLLGVGVPRSQRIPFVLLDEVHTYSGLPGAQGAMVIRRWKHASGADPMFVGLSATLLEARSFFQELTGVPEYRIECLEPHRHEMIDEGAEYQIALKSNPASQTSLLSTSIQTAMLMGRLVDPLDQSISGGLYGQRVFAFTDTLDVNTRLYDDLQDAEGFKIYGPQELPLASLRQGNTIESLAERELRDLDGQRWGLPEKIGHDLKISLRVGRTSSRDPGVARQQNIIVATASLEVGFNDSAVGAVIQHKAPKGFAAFLQRKGRAGRKRSMRPWTVTVLTAFGRDRLAFQGYHQLFEPVLESQHLPIRNLYIVRMQALSAFFDWMALQWERSGKSRGWLWSALSSPVLANREPELCGFALSRLDALIDGEPEALQSLSQYIKSALDITKLEVESILYAPPRSLLLEALPTLRRRLASRWQTMNAKQGSYSGLDMYVDYLPLPEFISANLFSQLAPPGVVVALADKPSAAPEILPVAQALREIVPGRVTRRFAEYSARISHWVEVDHAELLRKHNENHGRRLTLAYGLNEYVESIPLGTYPLPGGGDIMVYSPQRMRLKPVTSRAVSNMSNAWPVWHSHILATKTLLRYRPARRSRWSRVINRVDCYTHAQRTPVTVLRYTAGADASIRVNGISIAVRFNFVDEEQNNAGLGMEFETDGIAVRYRLPMAEQLATASLSQDLQASLRHAYYRQMVLSDDALRLMSNDFQLDWLQRIYLAAVMAWAVTDGLTLQEAHDVVRSRNDTVSFERAMQVVVGFQAPTGGNGDKLSEDLIALLENPVILQRLHSLGENLYSPDPERYFPWLRERLHENIALAVYEACLQNVPRHATMTTLLVDPEPLDPNSESAVIWITEDALGGSGVIEALAEIIAGNPGVLFNGIEAATAPSDLELDALVLEQVVRAVVTNPTIAEAVRDMRVAIHHQDRKQCWERLNEALKEQGIMLGHSTSVALNARLLRPSTMPEADSLIVDLLCHWDTLQQRLGVAIGLQEFCALAALDQGFWQRIQSMASPHVQYITRDAAVQLYSMLWPRQHEVRQQADSYHPYRPLLSFNEPKLIQELLLKDTYTNVWLFKANWRTEVLATLSRSETCRLLAPRTEQKKLARAVAELLLSPVDIEYLQFFPMVKRYEQGVDFHAVIFTIWEDI